MIVIIKMIIATIVLVVITIAILQNRASNTYWIWLSTLQKYTYIYMNMYVCILGGNRGAYVVNFFHGNTTCSARRVVTPVFRPRAQEA